jgi:hypothetical protein
VVFALGGSNHIARIALFNKMARVFKRLNVAKVREILGPEAFKAHLVVGRNALKKINGELAIGIAVLNFRFKSGG